jgi:hypothetical protein
MFWKKFQFYEFLCLWALNLWITYESPGFSLRMGEFMSGIYQRFTQSVKTLQVFPAGSRIGLHCHFAGRDKGLQKKPVGSLTYMDV